MRQRTFWVRCWTCDGCGQTGMFLNRNVHVTLECPTCRGGGAKALRRHKHLA